MALTIRMRVSSVSSTELDPEAPPLDLISEGMRRKSDGGDGAMTTVYLVAGPKELDTWNAPASLWISLDAATTGWEVGSLHDVTIMPAPVEGAAE
jgi:hypothetical protein